MQRLKYSGEIVEQFSPNFLLRHWPPAFKEWSTRSVRDTVYASPQFPRLLNPDSLRNTTAQGVSGGLFAYVGKKSESEYEPFLFGMTLQADDIEFSEDMYIISREAAEHYQKIQQERALAASLSYNAPTPGSGAVKEPPVRTELPTFSSDRDGQVPSIASNGAVSGSMNMPVESGNMTSEGVKSIKWAGDIPLQKWMTFYTRVLSPFALGKGVRLTLHVEISPDEGISQQKVDQIRAGLRDLGLSSEIEVE